MVLQKAVCPESADFTQISLYVTYSDFYKNETKCM